MKLDPLNKARAHIQKAPRPQVRTLQDLALELGVSLPKIRANMRGSDVPKPVFKCTSAMSFNKVGLYDRAQFLAWWAEVLRKSNVA